MKLIIILLVVAAVIAGLLLTLRTSRNTGMPSEDVIKRAQERTRAQDAKEKNDERAGGCGLGSAGYAGLRDDSHTSRGRTYRWQSHQRFLARRCLRNTASQRIPTFSSTLIEARLLTSTVEMTRSARRSKNAAASNASAISVAKPLPHSGVP